MDRFIHLGLGWIGDKGGGLERYQHGVCTAQAILGCDVTAWVQSRTVIDADAFTPHAVYAAVVFASQSEKRAEKLRKLRLLAMDRFKSRDFIFVSHHASVSGSLSDLYRRVPHVVHFHGPWADEAAIEGAPWWKSWFQAREERKVYHAADRIITLSEAFKELVVERYGVRRDIVRVVPGGIDTNAADPKLTRTAARQKLGWPLDRPIVLSVRRLVKRVGVDVLIEAVGKYVKEQSGRSDLLVLIGGTGPLRELLEQQIERLGLQNHVRLLGFVPAEDLSTAYCAADVSIVPTQSLEGFGLVTLESLAAGTPAIVTPVGSLPEVMTGLSPSLVLPGRGVAEIALGLRLFAEGTIALPDETACREYVRMHYDWSNIGPRVLDVYGEAG